MSLERPLIPGRESGHLIGKRIVLVFEEDGKVAFLNCSELNLLCHRDLSPNTSCASPQNESGLGNPIFSARRMACSWLVSAG
jgi:hypothetical protein